MAESSAASPFEKVAKRVFAMLGALNAAPSAVDEPHLFAVRFSARFSPFVTADYLVSYLVLDTITDPDGLARNIVASIMVRAGQMAEHAIADGSDYMSGSLYQALLHKPQKMWESAPDLPQYKVVPDPSPDPGMELAKVIPALDTVRILCPASNCPRTGSAPLRDLIIHLNDTHNWSRERIADWLDTLDADLTFQPASIGD